MATVHLPGPSSRSRAPRRSAGADFSLPTAYSWRLWAQLGAISGWPRDDRVAASAKLTRETVASVRAVCDLSPIAPAVQQITIAWRSQTALPAARFRPSMKRPVGASPIESCATDTSPASARPTRHSLGGATVRTGQGRRHTTQTSTAIERARIGDDRGSPFYSRFAAVTRGHRRTRGFVTMEEGAL